VENGEQAMPRPWNAPCSTRRHEVRCNAALQAGDDVMHAGRLKGLFRSGTTKLFALAEALSRPKNRTKTFLDLQNELSDTEEQIENGAALL